MNWFRTRRDQLELSQSKVVREFFKIGKEITISAISGWERGQVPNVDHVDAIAAVYKVTPQKVLSVIHEMSKARQEAATTGK